MMVITSSPSAASQQRENLKFRCFKQNWLRIMPPFGHAN